MEDCSTASSASSSATSSSSVAAPPSPAPPASSGPSRRTSPTTPPSLPNPTPSPLPRQRRQPDLHQCLPCQRLPTNFSALSSSGTTSGGSRQQPLFSPVLDEFDDRSAGLGFGGLVNPVSDLETIGGMDEAPSVCTSTITLPPTPPFSPSNLSSGNGGLSLLSSNSSTSYRRIPPSPLSTVIQDLTFGYQPSHILFPPPPPATVIPAALSQARMFFQEPIMDRLFYFKRLLNE